MPTQHLAGFQAQIARARDLVGLGQAIGGLTFGRVDGTDLYRFALVQAVAALDLYVHQVVLDRSVRIILGHLPNPTSASRTGLSWAAVREISSAASPAEAMLAARKNVAQRIGLETYQRPDDIGNALAGVGIGKIWKTSFGGGAESAKIALGLVVGRRNGIVHECDSDPLNPGKLLALTDIDALDAIATVESTVLGLDPHC